MNALLIDIIFVVFIGIMLFIGYKKGFITRLYDIATLVLVLFIAFLFAKPISSIWKLYHYDETNPISQAIGSTINQWLVFIVLLIVLYIVKKILGFFIKPLLKKALHHFSLTHQLDALLGTVLSFIESIIIAYLVVLFILIPFVPSGNEHLQNTLITKHLFDFNPTISEDVYQLTQSINQLDTSTYSLETLTSLMTSLNEYGFVSDEQWLSMFDSSVYNELQNKSISLSESEKAYIQEKLENSSYSKEEIKKLLDQINVSGE